MNRERGSLFIYLTEEQYRQVKNPKSFDLQCLRLIFIYKLHIFSGADSVIQKS
jgi:hypothetical protein